MLFRSSDDGFGNRILSLPFLNEAHLTVHEASCGAAYEAAYGYEARQIRTEIVNVRFSLCQSSVKVFFLSFYWLKVLH